MVEEIAGRAVRHGEVHGEGAEAAVGGQPEGRVLVEDLPVEVDADVGLHVLGRKVQNLESAGNLNQSGCTAMAIRTLMRRKRNVECLKSFSLAGHGKIEMRKSTLPTPELGCLEVNYGHASRGMPASLQSASAEDEEAIRNFPIAKKGRRR